MPRKKPGLHNLHVKVTEKNFRTLQEYCTGGIERITASAILNLFMEHYIAQYIRPRMAQNESATWTALQKDLPKATALIAHKIEPSAFEKPSDE